MPRKDLAARSVALSTVLCYVAAIFPILTAIGWMFDIPLLTQGHPALPAMQPLTALALVASAAAILATPPVPARRAWSSLAVPLAAVLALLGMLILSEYAFGRDIGIDRLLVHDAPTIAAPYPGRPSPQTALNITLIGIALISMNLGVAPRRVGQTSALLAAANAIIAATGYIFGSQALYGLPVYTPSIGMAINTAASFVLLAMALLCRQPGVGLMTLALSDTHTGTMLRPILAAAVLAPAVVGSVTRLGVTLGWHSVSTQISLFVLLIGGLVVWVTWRTARSAEYHERHAAATLDALQQTNQQLNRAIAERQVFAALVENSSDFIGIAAPDGSPTYLNPGGRRMVGLAADFPVDRTAIPDYYAPEEREFAANVIVKSMLERGQWQGETAFRHWQTGAAIPVSDTHFLIRHPDTNELLGMGTITRDISDARLAREEIEASNRRLQKANEEIRRLDALKTDFFANVSHEFRTPLTLILGSLDRYARPSSDVSDDLRRVLNVVLRNARTLLRYVNDLLDVARLDAGGLKAEYAEIDVADVIRLLSDQFSVVARERRITLHVDVPPRLRVQIDPARFQRIVLNLLSNAFKYAPDGGRIRVSLTVHGECFRLEVADSGPGIPAEKRQEVFERFRRLEPGSTTRGGAGLGLSIVKEFASLLGGTITIGDAPEGGALCVLELPCSAPRGTTIAALANGLTDARTVATMVEELRQRTGDGTDGIAGHPDTGLVLVVEDHPDMNRYIADIVKAGGFDVAAAVNGRDGYARAIALKPDLIVTDVMMPEMDGRDLIAAIRQHPELRTVPIVVLTARADEETRVQLLRGGADDYLDKPFSGAELLARVRNLIARKHSQDDATRLRQQIEGVADASRRVTEAVASVPEHSVLAVFQTIALKAASLTGAEYAAAGIGVDPNRPFDVWAFTGLSEEQARLIGSYPRPIGLLGLVSRENRTIRLRDLGDHPQHRAFPPNHPVMTSFMGTPIRFNSHAVGNLYVANKTDAAEFSDEDQRVFEMLAGTVGAAIEAARLYSSEGLQRAWLEAVVDQMPEGVVLVDADGRITMMNRVARSLMAAKQPAIGQPASTLAWDLRRPSGEVLSAEDLPLVTALTDRATTQGHELVAHRADGSRVPVLVGAAPIHTPDGAIAGATMILQDVSTLKELERLREEWASIVAHDLQQPVHTILLRTDLLLSGTLTAEQAESIRQIQIAIGNLGRMVSDLMDASLLEADRMRIVVTAVNLNDLLREIVNRSPDVTARVSLNLPAQPLFVQGDAQRLEQVVVNLLSNAVKYGAPGTAIGVDLSAAGDRAAVSVTNRGAGIAPDDLPYVFDRYARSGRSRGVATGLGLGLYIAKGLVEAHGGQLWAESTPGETTTFRFAIPMDRPLTAPRAPEREPQEQQVPS